jgi:hypothetical protein
MANSATPDQANDRDFCIVMARTKAGAFFAETDTDKATQESAIKAIADGVITDATAVIMFNPVENFSRDISEDVARGVLANHLDEFGEPQSWAVEFLETHLGCQTVADAVREWNS